MMLIIYKKKDFQVTEHFRYKNKDIGIYYSRKESRNLHSP
jgi:hypothetical protein